MGEFETEIISRRLYRLRPEFQKLFLDARTSRDRIPELSSLPDETRECLCLNLATLTEPVLPSELFRDHSKPSGKVFDRDPGDVWTRVIDSLEAAGYLEGHPPLN